MSPDRIIYTLALNEVAHIGDAYWRRVPGGWIITETFTPVGKELEIRLHPVFVPMHEEYRPERTGPRLQEQIEGKPPAPPQTITRPSRMNDDTSDDDNSPGF